MENEKKIGQDRGWDLFRCRSWVKQLICCFLTQANSQHRPPASEKFLHHHPHILNYFSHNNYFSHSNITIQNIPDAAQIEVALSIFSFDNPTI